MQPVQSKRLRQMAFAKNLLARRAEGERIGLLVLAVHDWKAGKWLEDRPNVARVVIPDESPLLYDFTIVAGLDVLVCGPESDDYFMAVRGVFARGAASVWLEDGDCAMRVEPWRWQSCGCITSYPGRVPWGKFPAALNSWRELAIVIRAGWYGNEVFAPVRAAMHERALGPEWKKLLEEEGAQ